MKDIFVPITAVTICFIVFYVYDDHLPVWLSALTFSGCITFVICFIRDIWRYRDWKKKLKR